MSKNLKRTLFIALAAITVMIGLPMTVGQPVMAQDNTPPLSFGDALTDLGRRYGRTIPLTDFDNTASSWKYDYVVFASPNLDCPNVSGNVTGSGQVLGYIITFVLQNVTWEYRVSETDRNSLILCSSSNTNAVLGRVSVNGSTVSNVTNTSGTTVAITPTVATDANGCPLNLPARLQVNTTAIVLPGPANRIRSAANLTGAIIGRMPAGSTFTVLEIGLCSAGIRWVRIQFGTINGYTAEGANGAYYLAQQ